MLIWPIKSDPLAVYVFDSLYVTEGESETLSHILEDTFDKEDYLHLNRLNLDINNVIDFIENPSDGVKRFRDSKGDLALFFESAVTFGYDEFVKLLEYIDNLHNNLRLPNRAELESCLFLVMKNRPNNEERSKAGENFKAIVSKIKEGVFNSRLPFIFIVTKPFRPPSLYPYIEAAVRLSFVMSRTNMMKASQTKQTLMNAYFSCVSFVGFNEKKIIKERDEANTLHEQCATATDDKISSDITANLVRLSDELIKRIKDSEPLKRDIDDKWESYAARFPIPVGAFNNGGIDILMYQFSRKRKANAHRALKEIARICRDDFISIRYNDKYANTLRSFIGTDELKFLTDGVLNGVSVGSIVNRRELIERILHRYTQIIEFPSRLDGFSWDSIENIRRMIILAQETLVKRADAIIIGVLTQEILRIFMDAYDQMYFHNAFDEINRKLATIKIIDPMNSVNSAEDFFKTSVINEGLRNGLPFETASTSVEQFLIYMNARLDGSPNYDLGKIPNEYINTSYKLVNNDLRGYEIQSFILKCFAPNKPIGDETEDAVFAEWLKKMTKDIYMV